MTAPIIPEVVTTRARTDGGQKVTEQVLSCNVPGCHTEMVVTVNSTLKPGDVILNMARRRGWHVVGDGRKVRSCSLHNRRVKAITQAQIEDLARRFKTWFEAPHPWRTDRKNALIAELKKLGISKVTEAKNEAQRKALLALLETQDTQLSQEPDMANTPDPVQQLEAAGRSLKSLEESLKLPTQAARAQRRKVFHEIEECYAEGQYLEGFSDEAIAKKLLVSIGTVAEIREMNFGPDPRITDLRKQIAALEDRVGQIETAALTIMEQAETKSKELRRDIASLLDQINKLEGKL